MHISFLLSFLTVYFFAFVPTATILSSYGLPVSLFIWLSRAYIFYFAYYLLRNYKEVWTKVVEHKALFLTLLAFFVLQYVFQFFYYTLPEWDTYGDLIKISQMISGNTLQTAYRPLYFSAISLLSQTLRMDPYYTLLYILLPLQSSLILVGYYFLHKKYGLLWLFTLMSVPVINIEIGTIRPQSILIVFVPIFIFFLKKWHETKQIRWKILSTAIAVGGMYYHEMFAFVVVALLIYIILIQIQKLKNKSKKIPILYLLLVTVTFLWLSEVIPSLAFVKLFLVSLISRIINPSHWKLWFLNSYGTDGLDIGWTGLGGILRYYGYYVSPIILVSMLVVFKHLFSVVKKDIFSMTLFLVFLICSSLSEIFPRLGFTYLPERIWLLGDIVLLLLFMKLIGESKNVKTFLNNKIITSLTILSVLLGISGSTYIAFQKKSLTNREEMPAAEWIRNNTDPDSIIFSQPANISLIEYFGKRKINTLSDELLGLSGVKTQTPFIYSQESEPADNIYNRIKNFDTLTGDLNEFVKDVNMYRSIINPHDSIITSLSQSGKNIYLLYSNQKFKNIYATRKWWLDANYYGVDLNLINTKYKLVYSKNEVYIWRIK